MTYKSLKTSTSHLPNHYSPNDHLFTLIRNSVKYEVDVQVRMALYQFGGEFIEMLHDCAYEYEFGK